MALERKWTNDWTKVKPIENAPELLQKELPNATPGTIMISFMTDPYQPAETQFGITHQCLEVIIDFFKTYPEKQNKWKIMILTKNCNVIKDLFLFQELKQNIEVGFTITSPFVQESDVTSPVDKRYGTLLALKKAGISTFISVEPMFSYTYPVTIYFDTCHFVDKYYLGKLNHFKEPKIDYVQDVFDFLRFANPNRSTVIIKPELKKRLDQLDVYNILSLEYQYMILKEEGKTHE